MDFHKELEDIRSRLNVLTGGLDYERIWNLISQMTRSITGMNKDASDFADTEEEWGKKFAAHMGMTKRQFIDGKRRGEI